MNVDMVINKKDDGKMLLIEGILRKVTLSLPASLVIL